ncbi:DUF503 domain-containing protein [Marinobacter nauticus]|jgi:hypothetical protein|uniref:DUF503 domain-containing protein n=1 Tax=Marinobacter nauticus TaxID=2743 RepID=A0A833NA25_MARNT|nr:DUF503 domain-containing protein [Marinobacter nauticus]KAE8546427.1 hypothetical protein F6453_1169 [Marinobacter nauticus]
MAEQKRHMDVPKERFLESQSLPAQAPKLEKQMSEALRKLLKEGKTPQQHQDITPHVGVLTLHFQLYGCEDLKAKRKAFTAMKAIWGKEPDLAVAETADQEALDCATWTIAALGASAQQITQRLDQVEKDIEDRIDAAILDVHREIL